MLKLMLMTAAAAADMIEVGLKYHAPEDNGPRDLSVFRDSKFLEDDDDIIALNEEDLFYIKLINHNNA